MLTSVHGAVALCKPFAGLQLDVVVTDVLLNVEDALLWLVALCAALPLLTVDMRDVVVALACELTA